MPSVPDVVIFVIVNWKKKLPQNGHEISNVVVKLTWLLVLALYNVTEVTVVKLLYLLTFK